MKIKEGVKSHLFFERYTITELLIVLRDMISILKAPDENISNDCSSFFLKEYQNIASIFQDSNSHLNFK